MPDPVVIEMTEQELRQLIVTALMQRQSRAKKEMPRAPQKLMRDTLEIARESAGKFKISFQPVEG